MNQDSDQPIAGRVFQFAAAVLVINVALVGWALYIGAAKGNPERHFEETGFITWVSYFQLLATGAFGIGTYVARRKAAPRFWSAVVVWLLAGVGFIVLAIDERHRYHEKLDNALHDMFKLTESAWSDRIDDLIILSYGLIGIGVLWVCRKEVLMFRPALRFLYIGFAGLGLMVMIDVFSNRGDLLKSMGAGDDAESMVRWFGAVEDSIKLLAEAFFLIGFFAIFLSARRLARKG